MKNGILIENGYAILPGAKAFVSGAGVDSTKPKVVAPKELDSFEWSQWGDDNLFPQNVLEDLRKNSISLRAFEKRKAVHFGRGIIAYREGEEDPVSKEKKRIPVTDKEVVEFFRLNNINRQFVDHIGSLEIFANSFNEMILNKERTRINRLFFKDPAYCRLAKIDQKTFKIPSLYYSAQWNYYPSKDSGTIVTIPMFDAEKYNNGVYADRNFVFHSFYRSFNTSYYHYAVWLGIRESGWLDIANKVPKLKTAIMKNQMTIKYHIVIPNDYWESMYPSPDYTREQREEKRLAILEDMNDFLSNVENTGKTLITESFYNKVKMEYLDGWKINVIDNKLKDDAYIPDSEKANSEILFAIGVDPTLLGSGIPGGKLGAGSGSDKREAFWQLNSEMGIYRQVSLEPLYFIRDFNGWDPTIKFDYITVDTSQTMNANPTKTEKRIDQNAQ